MEEQLETKESDVNQEEHFDNGSSRSLDILNSIMDDEKSDGAEKVETEVVEDDIPKDEAVETKIEAPKEPIVDDELISLYPTLSSLKGKPISEVAKSYDSLTREYTKLTQQPKKETKTEIEPIDDEMPDPYDEPKEFKAWVKAQTGDVDKLVAEKLKEAKEAEKAELEAKAQSDREFQAEVKRYQKEISDGLTSSLPEGITPQVAFDFYVEQNKAEVLGTDGKMKPELEALFSKNPQYLVKTIADFAKLEQTKNMTKADIKNKAFELTKNGFKKKPVGELRASQTDRTITELTDNEKFEQELFDNIRQSD